MGYDVEKGFISKLLETNDIKTIKDLQIKSTYFSGYNRSAFNYIMKHISNHGVVPTVRVFETKFPDYELYSYKAKGSKLSHVGTEEQLTFWCEELRTRYKHNKLAELIELSANDLDNLSTEKAFNHLKSELTKLDSEVTISNSVKVNDCGEDRKKAYLEKKDKGGLLGLSTGFPILDSITRGLIDECLITIVASTGVGKTWFEVLLGSACLLQSCTVMQFVTEMSTSLMQDRYDSVLFSKLHSKGISYRQLKNGKLSPEMQKEYFDFLDNEYPKLEDLWLETATGVMAMEQRIKEVNPDVVLVDAVYLMEDDQNAKDDWLRLAHITRDLKKLAKRIKKPIIINTQLDEKTGKKTSPKLGDIKYTQALGQDSDIIIALFRDEVMINDREMGLSILKNREGEGGKITLTWDFNSMNFSEVYSELPNSEDEEDYSGDSKGTLNVMEE